MVDRLERTVDPLEKLKINWLKVYQSVSFELRSVLDETARLHVFAGEVSEKFFMRLSPSLKLAAIINDLKRAKEEQDHP